MLEEQPLSKKRESSFSWALQIARSEAYDPPQNLLKNHTSLDSHLNRVTLP